MHDYKQHELMKIYILHVLDDTVNGHTLHFET